MASGCVTCAGHTAGWLSPVRVPPSMQCRRAGKPVAYKLVPGNCQVLLAKEGNWRDQPRRLCQPQPVGDAAA